MTLTVRLTPDLEALLAAESRRRGVTKSEVVKDAIERVLGRKNPREILDRVRSGKPMGNPTASQTTSAKFKAKLRAKRSS